MGFSCLWFLSRPLTAAGLSNITLRRTPSHHTYTFKQGFENNVAEIMAQDLRRAVQFVWLSKLAPYAERKLGPDACDLSMAAASPTKEMLPSIPYYRSSYVFVTRADRHLDIASLNDPHLASYRIGAQIIGDADEATPPAEELAQRGLASNIIAYTVFGYPLGRNTAQEMINAVTKGDLDLAIVWGPAAGYFAKSSAVPLVITRILPSSGKPSLPEAFDISVGVRRGDDELRQQVNEIITRRQKEISAVLTRYGVPLLDRPSAGRARGSGEANAN
jgi:mxaJ protein